MQNYEESQYSLRDIAKSGARISTHFTHSLSYQTICAFQSSFGFIMALQFNTWVTKIIEDGIVDFTQMAVLFLILIPVVVIISWAKSAYAEKHSDVTKHVFDN